MRLSFMIFTINLTTNFLCLNFNPLFLNNFEKKKDPFDTIAKMDESSIEKKIEERRRKEYIDYLTSLNKETSGSHWISW